MPADPAPKEPDRRGGRRMMVAAGIVVTLGAALRAAGLSRWCLAADEWATLQELARGDADPLVGHAVRLGFEVLRPGVALLGANELGVRAVPFVCGVASLAVVLGAGWRVLGPAGGVSAGALAAASAWHVFFSQYGRFYAPAFFCSTAALAALAVGVREARRGWLWIAAGCGAAAVAMHTFAVLPVGAAMVAAWLIVARPSARPAGLRPVHLVGPTAMLAALAAPAVRAAASVGRAWVEAQDWGYGPGHLALGLAARLTLPLTLAACVGAVAAGRSEPERPALAIWASAAGGAAVALVAAAQLGLSVRPDYFFPAAGAAYWLAGAGIAREACRRIPSAPHGHATLALGWTAAIMALQFPDLVSYYSCGNRYDVRAAVAWIAERASPDDHWAGRANELLVHYGAPPERTHRWRELLRDGPPPQARRLWIVLEAGRRGLPDDEARWLGRHASLVYASRPKRIDYLEYEVQGWLWRAGIEPVRE